MEKKPAKNNATILERRFVQEGAYIMREGEVGSSAFLIQSGKVAVYTENSGVRTDLATMGPGQIVGEMALVFDAPRTATVEALEDCNLIAITRQSLQGKLEKSDPTIRAIVPMLMKRVLDTSNALIKKSANLDDMVETANIIYQNMQASLSAQQRTTFQKTVAPKLDEFLSAIKKFESNYNEK